MVGAHNWNAELYDLRHHFVTDHGRGVVNLLNPQPGERILDLGCGTGHLTHEVASRGAEVVGLDVSPDMIASAQDAYPHLSFVIGDATTFVSDAPFDAVFSNAALHWMPQRSKVIERVWQALRPGGRFVAEQGGKGNVQALIEALYDAAEALGQPIREPVPWYFPGPAEYSALLEAQGFRVALMMHYPRRTALDGGDAIENYLRMYVPEILASFGSNERQYIRAVEDRLRLTHYQDDRWHLDHIRLRSVVIRPLAPS